MGWAVLTNALRFDLTTLATVKDEAGLTVTDATRDARLSRLITRRSEALADLCGRIFARQQYRETIAGPGGLEMRLTHYPIAGTPTITRNGEAITDFSVRSAAQGILFLSDGWGFTQSSQVCGGFGHAMSVDASSESPVPTEYLDDYIVDYWGGCLLPSDNYTATTISFSSADNSINDTAAGFPLLVAGDTLVVSGSAANNGRKTVVSRTASKIVVSETVVDGMASASVTLTVSTLPPLGEELCITLVKASHYAVGRDPSETVISDQVGDRRVAIARPTRAAPLFGGLLSDADIEPLRRVA